MWIWHVRCSFHCLFPSTPFRHQSRNSKNKKLPVLNFWGIEDRQQSTESHFPRLKKWQSLKSPIAFTRLLEVNSQSLLSTPFYFLFFHKNFEISYELYIVSNYTTFTFLQMFVALTLQELHQLLEFPRRAFVKLELLSPLVLLYVSCDPPPPGGSSSLYCLLFLFFFPLVNGLMWKRVSENFAVSCEGGLWKCFL